MNIRNIDAFRSGLQKYREQTGGPSIRAHGQMLRDIRRWDGSGRFGSSDEGLAEKPRVFAHTDRMLTTSPRESARPFSPRRA